MTANKLALTSLRVEQFKAIQDSGQIDLNPLTAFIGYNGSGKSSLIEALETLQDIVTSDLDIALQRWRGIEQIRNKHTVRSQNQRETKKIPRPHYTHPIAFRFRGYDSDGQYYTANLLLNIDPNGQEIFIQEETLSLRNRKALKRDAKGQVFSGSAEKLSTHVDSGESALPISLKSFISRWQFLLLTPNEMGQPSTRRRTGGAITLNKDGSNIAEYLLDIRKRDTGAFNGILETLQHILDYAGDLQPTLTSELEQLVYLQLTEGVAKIPGWLLSSGTLRLISLLAVLRHPKPPPLIVIEEVENGFDPRTVQLIAKEIKKVTQSGRSQVIITTHSPSLLDMLDLSNIILVKRGEEGPAFHPPSDNESLRIWAHSYGLGHLYVTNTLQNFMYEGKEADTVKRIELGLRGLIDARLSGSFGIYYWRRHIPGDVKNKVHDRIKARIAEFPYEPLSNYSDGAKKLNFCDVGDYKKIIHSNWATFENIFIGKDTLARYLDDFSVLRNATAHNYEDTLNEVQKKSAEAAVLWLENMIVAYITPHEADLDDGEKW